ncbi:MAG: hypothetical protein IPK74_20480 [Deltaproteobacteria bacterium]|nr:hypothetical protein [Deltaproteobacteria bacterium]
MRPRALIASLLWLASELSLPSSAGAAPGAAGGRDGNDKPSVRRHRRARTAPAAAAPTVFGVQRQFLLELPLAAIAQWELRRLPGDVGFELLAATSGATLREAAFTLDPAFVGTLDHEGERARLRVVHASGVVRFAHGPHDGKLTIAFGLASEETRLRELADALRRPLPEPAALGAELEVWQEAERVTAAGDLSQAMIRWERLTEVPALADLAALRVAELFITSGHVNEAMARLRGVARTHPRSVGAALARLDVLQLEAITGEGEPSRTQVDVAQAAVDGTEFDAFARLRATMVLHELGDIPGAFGRMPTPAELPPAWQGPAESMRQQLVELTMAAPMLRGDPRTSAIHWAAWSERVGQLVAGDAVVDAVAAAHERLGLFDVALPLLKQRLREHPTANAEADIVARLAHAYRMLDDLDRANEAVEFDVAAHPDVPSLPGTIAAIAIAHAERHGLAAGRSLLARYRKHASGAALPRAIDAIDIELVLAWGTPAQIVHVLSAMRSDPQHVETGAPAISADPVTASRHRHALAVALVRAGRHAEAEPLLRELAARSRDPVERDRLAYHLGVAELGERHRADAMRIFADVAGHGTRWSSLAKARMHEVRLDDAAAALIAVIGLQEAP